MSVRAGTWVLGLAGSVLAHGGLLGLLLIAIRPEPVTEQPMPTSELEVQAYELDRTDAREKRPESQRTDTNTPEGTELDSGAIPQSRAKSASPTADAVRPEKPKPTTIAPARQSANSIPAKAPAVNRLNSVTEADIKVAKPSEPEIAPVVAVLRMGTELPEVRLAVATMETTRPTAAVLPQAQSETNLVPATNPVPWTATPQRPEAAQLPVSAPSAQKLKASLAFSGAGGDVDPVSIAAFQSFMQPGDITASGDQLRDGVSGLLAQVPCSRMQVAFDPDTATLQVNGHIPDNDLRAPVLAALRTQMGANIAVSDNILILPRPQCGALSGIAGVGLPQSTDQITNPLVIGEDAHARVFTFAKGDLLSLDMTAPDYDAYIYLDYFDAEGSVLHLEPNEYAHLRRANAQAVQQIGAKTMQDSGLKLVIGPPYGQEIAVAFAASEPLYDGLRPIQEPAAEYLEWLKARVKKARADHSDFKGEWVYFFVSTAEG